MVKNLSAMQETRAWSLAQEDPLEKGMGTHPSIFARRIPWIEDPGGLQFMRSQRVGHYWATNTHTRSVCRNTNMIKQNLIAQNLGHLKKFFSLWEFKNVHRRREKSIMNPSSHFSHYQHMANHLSPSCMSLTSLPWIILSKSQTLYHFIHDISLCMSQR